MAYNLKDESEVKDFVKNLGTEYRFGCYSEKNPEVCHLLGDYLESIKKDYEKAAKVYKTNCNDYKYGKSCYKFGNYTMLGKGKVKSNYDEAFEYYLKGCELNDANSCQNAGLMCISNSPNNTNRKKDYTQGMNLLEKCCQAKVSFCCYYISGMYIAGVPDGNISKDMQRAFKYSVKACELGNMYACANLSQMYHKGDGVAKDESRAAEYRKLAIDMQDQEKGKGIPIAFGQGIS